MGSALNSGPAVHLAIGDRHAPNEEVGHVLLDTAISCTVLLPSRRIALAMALDGQPVRAQHGVVGELELAGDAAALVGGHRLFEDPLALGVVDLHDERAADIALYRVACR